MKQVLNICMLIMILVSCKKDQAPEPKSQPTPPPSTTPSGSTSNCQSSTWTYKVEFGTPVSPGMFAIKYLDDYGNNIHDTTATGTEWSISVSPFTSPSTLGVCVVPGLYYYLYVPPGTNLTNTVRVSVLRDGVVIQTTGIFLNFCRETYNGPVCPQGTVREICKYDFCT